MIKTTFSITETNLMILYNTGSRNDLIVELGNMLTFLDSDEASLRDLTLSTITKLKDISDKDYAALKLSPDYMQGW